MRYHIVYVSNAQYTNWAISQGARLGGYEDLNEAYQDRESLNQALGYTLYVYRVVEEAELKTLGLR